MTGATFKNIVKSTLYQFRILLLGVVVALPYSINAEEQPNIVFILADDISAEDVGCYGNPGIKTPNIDRLAGAGIRFQNGFVTMASCAPSRGSIMLSRYPHATGMAELKTNYRPDRAECNAFVERLDNMAQVLQQAGYYTMQSGKWHIGGLYSWNKPDGHFQQFFDSADPVNLKKDAGTYRWLELLKMRPNDKPFFCWFATFDAHRYSAKAPVVHRAEDVQVPPYLPTVSTDRYDTKIDLAGYYDKITRADRAIGAVVDELKAQGIFDNTLIVILADNGRGFGRSKIHIHDSGVRVPFIAHWPKGIRDPNRVSYDLVSSIDLAPTFLELAGGSLDGTTFQGRSLLPIFNNKQDRDHRRAVFSERNHHIWEGHERGVRTQEFLYIKNRRAQIQRRGSDNKDDYSYWIARDQLGQDGMDEAHSWFFEACSPEELFDVKNDPAMLHNLVDSAAHQEILQNLRSALKVWEVQTGDTAPKNLTKHFRDPGERNRPKIPGPVETLIGEQPGWSYWKGKSREEIIDEASATRSSTWLAK